MRNLTNSIDPLGIVTTYGYDAHRRVTSVTRHDVTNAILGYDARDNAVSVTDARANVTATEVDDFGNERSVISPDSGITTSSYDAAGNLVSDGARTFEWDALGRLKEVRQGEEVVATYGYDIQNRRVRKTVGNETTYYLYNLDDQLIAEISGNGAVLREYVWLDGEPLVLAEYTGANAGVYFYVNDHLGTPQQLRKSDGTVMWQAAYLPFGEAQVQLATVTNNFRFRGNTLMRKPGCITTGTGIMTRQAGGMFQLIRLGRKTG